MKFMHWLLVLGLTATMAACGGAETPDADVEDPAAIEEETEMMEEEPAETEMMEEEPATTEEETETTE
ncbi:MAG: hypothetical protein LPK03_09705 [Pontibacter sp.]|nr:hypothetical protein [Pontibacter sp.]